MATIVKPLRDLTKKGAKWKWEEEQKKALKELKEALVTKTMAYFDTTKRVELTVDASPVGLGLIMAQYKPKSPSDKKAVLFASRTLSDVERRHSQVEKEALG